MWFENKTRMDISNKLTHRSQSLGMLFLLILIGVFSICVRAQGRMIPDAYLKITPGISTRNDVERILGKNDRTAYMVDYLNSEAYVGITYSRGTCDLGPGLVKLPEWTVENIFYHWRDKREPKLNKIILNRKAFVVRQIGDVIGHDYYVNETSGITIVYDRHIKRVIDMEIELTKVDREKYSCN